jgi:hypothetical protein
MLRKFGVRRFSPLSRKLVAVFGVAPLGRKAAKTAALQTSEQGGLR